MPVHVKCPSCSTVLQAPEPPPPSGMVRCPKCTTVLRLPSQAPAPAPAAPPPRVAAMPPAPPPPAPPLPPVEKPPRVNPSSAPVVQAPSPIKSPSKRRPPTPPPPVSKPRGERPPTEAPSRKPKSSKSVEPKAAATDTVNPNIFAELTARDRDATRKATPKSTMNPYWLWGGTGALTLLCIVIIIFGFTKLNSAPKAGKKKKDTAPAVEAKVSPEQERQSLPEKEQKEKKAAPDKDAVPPTADQARPAAKALDPAFIPSSCNAALVIHPARILRSKSPLLPPPDLRGAMLDEATKATGIDPRRIEQVIVLVDPLPGGNVAFFPGGIFRFAEAVDGKKLLGAVLKETEQAQAEGKTYLRSKSEKMAKVPLSGFVADERTLLLAPEPTLKKMLAAATKVKSPLIERLGKLDLSSDISGVFVVEPIRSVLAEMAKSPDIPPNLAGLKSLDKTLDAATLTLNVDGAKLLEIVLHGRGESSATELEKLAKAALDMGKQAYGGAREKLQKQLSMQLPPELATKILRVADQIDKGGVKATKKGSDVFVTLEKPKDL